MKMFLVVAQAALAILLILIFFDWAPSINCQSLDELSSSKFKDVKVPEDAKCFNINHGEIHFSDRLPIKEEPQPFIISSLFLVLCFSVLAALNWYHRKLNK